MSNLQRLVSRLPKGARQLLKSLPGATALRDSLYREPRGEPEPPGALKPVVYLPTWLEWDVMKQRPQYLMEAFAKAGHPVWFVDPRLSEERAVGHGVRLVPSLRPTPRSDVILYTHFAPRRNLTDVYEHAVVIYDILDDLAIYDADEAGLPDDQTVRHHHRTLVRDADVVIVSNDVLLARHHDERSDVVLVENGVDPDVFAPDGPMAFERSERRVVGYHGAVAPWFDFDLVEAVAAERADLDFVVVGPVLPEVQNRMGDLAALDNVSVFGPQPADRIAAYVRAFDVGLIPFVVDEMTSAVTPLKMFEYLAAQVPVVATPLPACVAQSEVLVGADAAQFGGEIDRALTSGSNDREKLREEGLAASWDQRLTPLLDRLDSLGLRSVPIV